MWHLLLYLGLCGSVWSQFGECDYYQQLQPNQPYYIYSPNYPEPYEPGELCRWHAVAPAGSQVFLVCEDMNLPVSKECVKDHLAVSVSGDDSDVRRYCGRGGVTAISVSNRMTIELLTSRNSPGGSFLCNIGVQEGPEKPDKCECGWKNTMRIVGGTNTGVNEYPMMAALIDGTEKRLYCGATIISRNYAVTAAHCLIDKQPRKIGLLVGDYDISLGNDTDAAKVMMIDSFVVHPQYNSVTQANDIAVVHTEKPIQFGLRVGPVCLPFVNSKLTFAGDEVEALGWGTLDFGGKPSDTLRKVDLHVVTNQQCQKYYTDNPISSKQICTHEPGKDACVSDSGGPILWEDPQTGRIKLVGIISYGKACATEDPGVNTRVTSYLPWIMANADDEFCVT